MSSQSRKANELRELSLLFEISQILERSLDLREVANPVLKAMAAHMGMDRGTLFLLDSKTQQLSIEAGFGLSTRQRRRGKYQPGEGVTGRVVATGQPVVVPRISEEPLFLNRTGARNLSRAEISFLCVPIKLGSAVIGALSADRLFSDDVSLEEDIRLLTIIGSMISQAVQLRQAAMERAAALESENTWLKEQLQDRFRPDNIVGNSRAMAAVYQLIGQVADTQTTVLIRGESGTGKELAAHALHFNSHRKKRPFIKVNCAALPETIIESELFGHERGSFTGATSQRKGRFELASGGTIFLDEIGDFSPSTQIKLLRVLQEREFERVGGNQTIAVDVRVVAATNRNLEELIETGEFRQDLYYRLNVFPLHMPPLRERKTDVLLLADHFIEEQNRLQGKRVKRISTPAIDMLMAYHWPGNVRELENCMERAVLLSSDSVLHGHHLPPSLQTAEASGTAHQGTLDATLARVERELIVEALKSTSGNMAKSARQLGITERIMGLRVKRYQINSRRFRTKM